MIATLRGQEAFAKGQADRAIAYSEEALALLPERWRYVRGIAVLYWGLSMQATGRGDAAQRILIDEYESLLGKTDTYALRLLFTACFNAIETGYLEQARQMAQAMLDQATSGRLLHTAGILRTTFSEWCTTTGMNWTLPGSILGSSSPNAYSVHTQAARNGMIGLTRVHLARAEISAAWSVMELLSQLDLERLGQEGDDARSLRAQLAYLQGDTETALRWADAYAAPVAGSVTALAARPAPGEGPHPSGKRHGRGCAVGA